MLLCSFDGLLGLKSVFHVYDFQSEHGRLDFMRKISIHIVQYEYEVQNSEKSLGWFTPITYIIEN